MDRLVGLDAHASSCTLGLVSPGRKWVGAQVVATHAVRVKRRLKSVYRSRGVAVPGTAVYTAAKRGGRM